VDPFLTDDKLSLATLVADVMKNPDMAYALILDRKGRVVAADRSELIGRPYLRPKGQVPLYRPEPRAQTWIHPEAGKVIDIGIPLIVQDRTKIGEVHIGVSQSTIDTAVATAWRKVLGLAFAFVLVGVAGSIVLMTLMLRPISALAKGAQEIGGGNLDYQIPIRRHNELGQLAGTFNQMTQELKLATTRAIEQEKIKKELQLAHQIQQMLLPKTTPQIPGFSFAALYRAAKEVGGDYYDFVWVDKHRLAIAVADVCGKGVPAAMLMSVARSMLRSIAGKYASPASVVRELNRLLHGDLQSGLFITLFYAVLDISRGSLTYTSAGHNPAMHWQASGRKLRPLALDTPCMPLGLDKGDIFDKLVTEKSLPLGGHDVVVLYTDGVTEAMNAGWEEFGETRLEESLRRHVGAPDAQVVVNGLDTDLIRFCGDTPQSDDIAMAVIKVE